MKRAKMGREKGRLTVVLHDVVVGDAGYAGDGFGEEREPEAWLGGC